MASIIEDLRFGFRLLVKSPALTAIIITALGVGIGARYFVVQRTREIGVRMALGASRRNILQMVSGQGSIVILTGITTGVAGAFALSRFISGLLFGVAGGPERGAAI